MAVSSYLPDVAGGMVAAASFDDDAAAKQAVETLVASDVRPQEISVIARALERSARVAGEVAAWYPGKGAKGLARLLQRVLGRLPKELRTRYAKELAAGKIVVVAAAGRPVVADAGRSLRAAGAGGALLNPEGCVRLRLRS